MSDVFEKIVEKKLSQDYPVPFYVFDEEALKDHLTRVRSGLGKNMKLCYAVKANPFLISAMDPYVDAFEVCSPGELEICAELGIGPEKIVFSGVHKQYADIERAVRLNAGVLTIESAGQFELIRRCARELDRRIRVLPRLQGGSQFGMDRDVLEKTLCGVCESGHLELEGIQYFTGTQKKMKKVLAEIAEIHAYVKDLESRLGLSVPVLEYGPGLPVPYFQGDDFSGRYEPLKLLVRELESQGFPGAYMLEMGRYLAAPCGYYAASVVDIKQNQGICYALIDGGINHVNYYGQNMAMKVPRMKYISRSRPGEIREVGQEEGEEALDYCICGSLCTTADILVRKIRLPKLGVNDMIVLENIGAYSVTEGIYLFLSRRLPEIYLYNQKEGLRLVRESLESYCLNSIRK